MTTPDFSQLMGCLWLIIANTTPKHTPALTAFSYLIALAWFGMALFRLEK